MASATLSSHYDHVGPSSSFFVSLRIVSCRDQVENSSDSNVSLPKRRAIEVGCFVSETMAVCMSVI